MTSLDRVCPHCSADFTVTYPKARKTYCSGSCAVKAIRAINSYPGASNPNWRGGKAKHPLYQRYNDMIGRCHRPTHLRYRDYGGRGIVVCERWRDDFWNYAVDMGDPPDSITRWTIDRIDNNGPYSPTNCRWATFTQQVNNRRPLSWTTPKGHSAKLTREQQIEAVLSVMFGYTAREVATHYGVHKGTIHNIVNGRYSLI